MRQDRGVGHIIIIIIQVIALMRARSHKLVFPERVLPMAWHAVFYVLSTLGLRSPATATYAK